MIIISIATYVDDGRISSISVGFLLVLTYGTSTSIAVQIYHISICNITFDREVDYQVLFSYAYVVRTSSSIAECWVAASILVQNYMPERKGANLYLQFLDTSTLFVYMATLQQDIRTLQIASPPFSYTCLLSKVERRAE